MARFGLFDCEWELIRPLRPNKPRGVARVDDPRVLNGISWVLGTGSLWRGLPVAITLAPGQAADKAAVENLLALHPRPGDDIADRGHEARAVLDLIAALGGPGHIPTERDRRAQRSVDLLLTTSAT